jgi:hypothetical protein
VASRADVDRRSVSRASHPQGDTAAVTTIHAMQKFAAKLRYDIDALRNPIREQWPDQGQINWLKTLKRAIADRLASRRSQSETARQR